MMNRVLKYLKEIDALPENTGSWANVTGGVLKEAAVMRTVITFFGPSTDVYKRTALLKCLVVPATKKRDREVALLRPFILELLSSRFLLSIISPTPGIRVKANRRTVFLRARISSLAPSSCENSIR